MPASGGVLRYLRAKGSVDARAVNPRVREAFVRALREWPEDRTVRVVEIGGGAGGAFRSWMGLLAPFRRVEFTATDRAGDLLDAYRDEVRAWAADEGLHDVARDAECLCCEGRDRVLEVRLREAAAPDGFGEWDEASFDLLIAQSFWDLVPPGTAFALGRRLVAPGGIFYATLTFGGTTRFSPPHALDRRLLQCYHASMTGARGGDPFAGERLLGEVRMPGSGFSELASGRSDWRVTPTADGYPRDEAYFLMHVLGLVEKELLAAPEIGEDELDWWTRTRRQQLKDRQLAYSARQQDLVARRDG